MAVWQAFWRGHCFAFSTFGFFHGRMLYDPGD
jgi:hypothetical protein